MNTDKLKEWSKTYRMQFRKGKCKNPYTLEGIVSCINIKHGMTGVGTLQKKIGGVLDHNLNTSQQYRICGKSEILLTYWDIRTRLLFVRHRK